jgi:hypothetical protein
VNITGRIDLEIENFKTANGREPTKIKLGRAQVRALNAFVHQYTGHPAANASGGASPNYEGIRVEETSVEDQLDVE